MTRALRVMPTNDPAAMIRALRDSLTGNGPAVLPRELRGASASAVSEVPRAVALVIETSGSTGRPKRVALSTDALLASAAASASALGGQGQWLLALPAHYIAGAQVLIRSIVAETEPLSMAPGHFDPPAFCELAMAMTGDLRFVSLVPVQLARLMDAAVDHPDLLASLQRFDGILIGGQRLRTDLNNRARELGLQITTTYGSSETCGGCVYDGIPIGNTRARVVEGQLELAGAVLAEGYLDDPVRTARAFHEADGSRWYRTGDVGAIDGDRVTIIGRADNVIISGGEKVLLDRVEQALREVDGFGECVVVAGDDPEWGQVPVVVGVGLPEASLDDLRRRARQVVGRASAPARIVNLSTLPMLDSGKPDRVAIVRLVGLGSGK